MEHYIVTQAVQAAHDFMRDIVNRRDIGLLLGPVGCGKSIMLAHLADTLYSSDTPVLVYRTDVLSTPLAMLQCFISQLDVDWHGTTVRLTPPGYPMGVRARSSRFRLWRPIVAACNSGATTKVDTVDMP